MHLGTLGKKQTMARNLKIQEVIKDRPPPSDHLILLDFSKIGRRRCSCYLALVYFLLFCILILLSLALLNTVGMGSVLIIYTPEISSV